MHHDVLILWRLLWLMLSASAPAWAEITTLHSNARALGMGEAFTAVSRDATSLFFNPAGLSLVGHARLDLATVRAGASGFSAIGDIQKLTKGGDNSAYVDAVNSLYGRGAWTGLGLESTLVGPHFALGSFDHADARVRVENPVYPSIYTGVYNDFGYAAGLGVPLTDRFHFGGAFKVIKRTGARLPIGAATLADLNADEVQSRVTQWGRGFAVDLGADFLIPTPAFVLTAAGTWRNVGQTRFTSNDPRTDVPFDDNDITLGMAGRGPAPFGGVTVAVDYRLVNDSTYQPLRKFNFGLELDFPLLDIRGGYREGYYTYGAGVDLGLISVNAASYGVELGAYPGQIEDRRYVAEFKIGIDLDETFSRRLRRGRLKQRR